ncbi:MAG: TetR/AcrR family transcriptional regulator [Candidatus Zixiibacteriota bacterium]
MKNYKKALTPRQNKKLTDILAAGQTLFSKFGYRKTSVDDIARNANVAKGTIYKYYESKEDIFAAVIQQESDQVTSVIEEAVNRETDPVAKITAYTYTKLSVIRKAISFYHVSREIASELWPLMDNVQTNFNSWEENKINEILKEGVATGQFSIEHPEQFAKYLGLMSKALELELVMLQDPDELKKQIDTLLNTLIWGLAGQNRP